MSVEWIARKYYGRLNILPRRRFLLIIYVTLIVLIGIINSVNLSWGEVLSSVAVYFVLGTVLTIVYLPLALGRLFNIKRVLGLSLVTFAVSLVAELLFFRFTGLRGLGLVVASGFILIILSVFMTISQALILSTIIPLFTFISVNTLVLRQHINYVGIINAILIELISVSLGSLFIAYVESRGRRLSGVSPLRALRAFLNTWFTGDSGGLESLFNNIGTSDVVEVKSIVFMRDKEPNIALLFPRIHFGPFDDIGSSSFIHYVDRELEPRFKAFTFHTAGSHEHNLANNRDAVSVASKTAEALRNLTSSNHRGALCKPYRVRLDDGWEAFVLNGKDFLAAFISNRVYGNDDIPYNVWDILSIDDRSPPNTMVVDAHSCKGDKVTDPSLLRPLINRVLESYKCVEDKAFLIGYGESRASSMCIELCDTRVKALTINVEGERYGIIYLYGNNVDADFRAKLDRVLRSKTDLKDFEIVTPDDHSCAASLSESPYEVVKECYGLVETVVSSVKLAMNNEIPATHEVLTSRFEGIKIVGDKVLAIIESLSLLAKTTERGLMVLFLTTNILLPLLYVVLST